MYRNLMATIQVRDVPDEVLRALKAKAESRGQTLNRYLLGELEKLAVTRSKEEVMAQIESNLSDGLPSSVEMIK